MRREHGIAGNKSVFIWNFTDMRFCNRYYVICSYGDAKKTVAGKFLSIPLRISPVVWCFKRFWRCKISHPALNVNSVMFHFSLIAVTVRIVFKSLGTEVALIVLFKT